MNNARSFLIVDDNECFADALEKSLQRLGFHVVTVKDLTSAKLIANETAFDMISIDLRLDKEDGLQLIQPLRQLCPHARILALTGYASIATAVEAIKLGANNYLSKPANVGMILKAMEDDASFKQSKNEFEKPALLSVRRHQWEYIQTVLAITKHNVSAAARMLSMHRRTLQRMISKHAPK